MVHRIVWRVASTDVARLLGEASGRQRGRVRARGREPALLRPRGPRPRAARRRRPRRAADRRPPRGPAELALQGFHAVRAYSAAPERQQRAARGARVRAGRRRLGGPRRQARRPLPLRRAAGRARAAGRRQRPPRRLGLDDRGARGLAREGDLRRRPADPEIDRFYFKSIYFREPSGVLFEIATLGPGFTRRRAARAPRREALAAARLRAPARPRSNRTCGRSSTRAGDGGVSGGLRLG